MVKTKALISCAVTAQLIYVFVFAYADCWLSHAAALVCIMYNALVICNHNPPPPLGGCMIAFSGTLNLLKSPLFSRGGVVDGDGGRGYK